MDTHDRRRHRLRQHQRCLPQGRGALAADPGEILCRSESRGGPGQGQGIWHRGGLGGCAARRPGHRDRHQPDRAAGARPGQPAHHHGRQARLFGEAAGRALQRGPGADARRRRPGRARRLRARYLSRRRASGLSPCDRCRPDRPAGRGRRGGALARHGALAPESRVLLQARRRSDPRRRALLRDPAGQPVGTGRAGRRPGLDRRARPAP